MATDTAQAPRGGARLASVARGRHGWPMALAKGVAVMLAGMVIDTAISVLAEYLALRFA